MKLTIRSDVIENISNLLKQDYEYNLRFLFGKMKRSGFMPCISRWDHNCVREALEIKYSATRERVGPRIPSNICDIGFITDRHIVLSHLKEEEGDGVALTAFHVGTYDVILLRTQHEYQLEIKFTQKPLNIKEIFEPIKFLYNLFRKSITKVDDTSVKSIINEYNTLFNREQITPWIVPQGLLFLDETQITNMKDYIVMPMQQGKKCMLCLFKSGAYLISKKDIFRVNYKEVSHSLHNSVVMGYWHDNLFTGCDIVLVGGIDIRNKSFLCRMKQLRIVSIRFSFCETVTFYNDNISEYTEKLLETYEGVIFVPNHANYMNNRVFLYQPVENVGIKFRLEEYFKHGFTTYTLMTDNELFGGTKEFHYESTIPLSHNDRKFIGPLNNTIFEFRWESDGFMPYMHSYDNESSTKNFALDAWKYINNPLDKKLLISSLRHLKKNILIQNKNSNVTTT